MNLFERLTQWIGVEADKEPTPIQQLQTTLNEARRQRRLAQYGAARQTLDQAEALLDSSSDRMLRVAVALFRVELAILSKDYDGAESMLQTLMTTAQTRRENAQLAYIYIAQGMLAQARDQWDLAHDHYDEALKLARAARVLGAEGRAQAHLAATFLHDGNASYAEYLLQEALPKLNSSGEIESTSYFVGLLGEAKIVLGQRKDGLHLLGRALRLAEQMEYREYERRWHQALGIQAVEAGVFDEAKRHFMLVMTNGSGKPDAEDLVLTLTRLSKVCLRLGEINSALDYARQAHDELLRETDGDDGPSSAREGIRQRTRAAMGVVLRSLQAYEEALPYLQAVDEGYAALPLTVADYGYSEVLRNLAAVQAEFKDFDAALAAYKRVLAYTEANELPLEQAGCYRDRGILHSRFRHYEDAIQDWLAAARIYEAHNHPAQVARLRCDIGNLRRQTGQGKRAMRDYSEALMLLNSFEDDQARGLVLANAATAYVDQGDIATAESFFVDSIQIAQRQGDHQAEVTRRGNYGWFLLATGRPKRALETLALTLRQSESLGMTLEAAVQTDNLGLAHDEMGQYEKALMFHQQALERLPSPQDTYWAAVFRVNQAHTLLSLRRPDEAKALLDESITVARELQNVELAVQILTAQARLHMLQDDLSAVGPILEDAVNTAQRASLRRLLAEALCLRSEWHAKKGEQPPAREDWNAASDLLKVLRVSYAEHEPAWLN